MRVRSATFNNLQKAYDDESATFERLKTQK